MGTGPSFACGSLQNASISSMSLAGRRERLAKVSWTTTDLGGALSARGRPGGRLAVCAAVGTLPNTGGLKMDRGTRA